MYGFTHTTNVDWSKLEAIEAKRALKVSDIFLAAERIDGIVSWDDFTNIDRSLIEAAKRERYIEWEDFVTPLDGMPIQGFVLTAKGLDLIRKHMK